MRLRERLAELVASTLGVKPDEVTMRKTRQRLAELEMELEESSESHFYMRQRLDEVTKQATTLQIITEPEKWPEFVVTWRKKINNVYVRPFATVEERDGAVDRTLIDMLDIAFTGEKQYRRNQ